jgi:hypothetical protein
VKGMVDVVAGRMTIMEINREVVHYMIKSPKRLIVNVILTDKGYHSTIWIDRETFKKKC